MKKIENDPSAYRTRDGFAKGKGADGPRSPVRLSKDQRDKIISSMGKTLVGKSKHLPFGRIIRK